MCTVYTYYYAGLYYIIYNKRVTYSSSKQLHNATCADDVYNYLVLLRRFIQYNAGLCEIMLGCSSVKLLLLRRITYSLLSCAIYLFIFLL
jgi:hypothetical protein